MPPPKCALKEEKQERKSTEELKIKGWEERKKEMREDREEVRCGEKESERNEE